MAALPSAETQHALYRCMRLIRAAEERLGADSRAGVLPGNVHLYIGQEAIAAGVCAHLSDADTVASTHRGHGHFLAKGGELRALVAEVYGRRTGACGGLGGSMHVADLSKGMLGANGIVGGGIAISAGAALAAQLEGQGAVAVAFFGDGAAAQGVLGEVMNIAALWALPLVLVCEHNGYSEFSSSASVNAGRIADRAVPFGLPSVQVDGNDVFAVWQAAGEAIARARRGEGASFIEAMSYRTHGHLEAEAGFVQKPYRSEEEIAAWRAKDPIARLSEQMLAHRTASREALQAIDADIAAQVADAVAFAEASEPPALEAALACGLFDTGVAHG